MMIMQACRPRGGDWGSRILPPLALAAASHMLALRRLSVFIYSSSGATRQRRALLIPTGTGAASEAPSLHLTDLATWQI